MIIEGIPFTMGQISDEVKSMEEQHKFLKSGNTSLLRVDSHRASCKSFSRGSCNCNRGAITFSEINDVESQLLNTETTVKTKSIQRVRPETSIGLENFSRVFLTPNATDSLDTALSVGTLIPGESRGTGNQFFGVNGKLSSTFAYWRRVLEAAFSIIPRLYELIQVLWQRLTSEGARADAAEARANSAEALANSAEAQGAAARAAHLLQIEKASRQHSTDIAHLAQSLLQLAAHCAQLQQEKEALHAKHTIELRTVEEAREQERTNHRNAQEAFRVRGERGLPELKALHATKKADMAAQIRVLEDVYRASMCILEVAQSAAEEETRRSAEAVQANARVIEEASARAEAQRTAFIEELAQNHKASAVRLEELVALMSEVTKRWTFGVRMQTKASLRYHSCRTMIS
jgi:hypothetical protein